MAERTTTTHGFGIEPDRQQPIARVSPESLTKVLGAIVQFDGRGSESPDGSTLTYTWTVVDTPLGSTVERLTEVEEDGSVVRLTPDLTGPYVLQLVASSPYRDSDPVQVTVEIQAAVVPYTSQVTPDASWIFGIISDFWSLVEDRKVYETYWSSMVQVLAADLLRAYQIDYNKSISTIQALFQRRWLAYEPKLELDETYLVFGHEQSGNTAFTGTNSGISSGILISNREFILTQNTPSSDAVGTYLTVFSSQGSPGNVGEYLINRLNSSNTGYIVSESTPFPSPSDEHLLTGVLGVTFQLDPVIRLGADAVAAGVAIGDFLRIEYGVDAGVYEITKVGTPDGLANDAFVEVATPPSSTKTQVEFTILRRVKASFARARLPNTDTVYIPEADADLTVYETAAFRGEGSISGLFEVLVEARHVFDALVGQTLRVVSGVNGGRNVTIAGVNDSRTGYLIGTPFSGTFPQSIVYEIPVVADISSRILILGDRAHTILSAVLDRTQPVAEDGGRGPLWVITLEGRTAPSGQEGLEWRIANSVVADPSIDFEELGVFAGDLLQIRLSRQDGDYSALLPCTVLGAVSNKIAFTLGTSVLESGNDGYLTNTETIRLSNELQVPAVQEDVNAELVYSGAAEEVFTALNSTSFRKDNFNLPIGPTTDLDLDAVVLRVSADQVIRNTRLPVDETVVSVPALFEYIATPVVGQDSDGNLILVGKDEFEVVLQDLPLTLLENRDYTVGAASTLKGSNASTVADSEVVTLPFADLLDRDVRVGDELELTSGFDQGLYRILRVLDDVRLEVMSLTGEVPSTTTEGLSYTVIRRTPGRFLRFAAGLFTPELPAPERLWAETTFFDNTPTIEDNFGSLVNITKEQLDAFGSSQVTYKGVVSGLMYAFTTGATLLNAAIGAHFLLGLPVTEHLGQVIDVDSAYEPGVGRIMIEDLDDQGQLTGLVRIFFFVPEGDEVLPEFAGLSTNPETGREWEVGDIVPQFTPLSNGVIIEDYLKNPRWWQAAGATGARELQKFHTWQAAIDVRQVDSRDVGLVNDFLFSIRPQPTSPEVVVVLYMLDEVTVEDDLLIEFSLYFYDDPAFSLEQTHMVGSTSNPPNRQLEVGSRGLRTLFEGHDLVSTDGSGIVTSARGGFTTGGTLASINAHFPDPVTTRGDDLVKPGHLLFIPSGRNRGRFLITGVTDDNTLTVAELEKYPPGSFPSAEFVAAEGQRFYIEVQDRGYISTSTGFEATGSQVEDVTANFQFDAVAVDDLFVVTVGANRGVYTIVRVGIIDGFGDNVDLQTKLVLDRDLPSPGADANAYTIYRVPNLRNPLARPVGDTQAGQQTFVSTYAELNALPLRTGDEAFVIDGDDAGKTFVVIDVVDDTLFLDQPFTSTENDITLEIRRALLGDVLYEEELLGATTTESPDSDIVFERLFAQDSVDLVLLRPQTEFLEIDDFALLVTTASSATDLVGAGVTTDMTLEIENVSPSSGVYNVESVVGGVVGVDHQFQAPESGVTGWFLEDAADFNATGASVSSVSLIDYEALGVRPGDILVLGATGDQEFVILSVSTSTVTLTETTGLAAVASTGKILRRVF